MKKAVLAILISFLIQHSYQSGISQVKPVKSKAQLKREVLNSAGYKVIAFFSPQCGACQNLIKILDKSSTTMVEGNKPIAYYSVNVLEIPSMIPIYHIAKLPLLVIYDGATKKSQQESETLSQEFLVNNFIKRETGIPGANPNFAKTNTLTLEKSFAVETPRDNPAAGVVSLSQRLFARVYQDEVEDGIYSQEPEIPSLIV